jgi:hypothetical protein
MEVTGTTPSLYYCWPHGIWRAIDLLCREDAYLVTTVSGSSQVLKEGTLLVGANIK